MGEKTWCRAALDICVFFFFYKAFYYPPTPVLPQLFQTGGVPTVCCCVCRRVVWLACRTLSAALVCGYLTWKTHVNTMHVSSWCADAAPRQRCQSCFSFGTLMLTNKLSLCDHSSTLPVLSVCVSKNTLTCVLVRMRNNSERIITDNDLRMTKGNRQILLSLHSLVSSFSGPGYQHVVCVPSSSVYLFAFSDPAKMIHKCNMS